MLSKDREHIFVNLNSGNIFGTFGAFSNANSRICTRESWLFETTIDPQQRIAGLVESNIQNVPRFSELYNKKRTS